MLAFVASVVAEGASPVISLEAMLLFVSVCVSVVPTIVPAGNVGRPLTCEDVRPVRSAPLTAGSRADPSSCTKLLAAVPTV